VNHSSCNIQQVSFFPQIMSILRTSVHLDSRRSVTTYMNFCRLWFISKALWNMYSILYLSFSWPYSHTLEKNANWLMPSTASAAIPLYPLSSHISLTCQRHPSVRHAHKAELLAVNTWPREHSIPHLPAVPTLSL